MAAMMASTLAGSRPSEKLGTHSTSVDISGKDSWRQSREAREGSRGSRGSRVVGQRKATQLAPPQRRAKLFGLMWPERLSRLEQSLQSGKNPRPTIRILSIGRIVILPLIIRYHNLYRFRLRSQLHLHSRQHRPVAHAKLVLQPLQWFDPQHLTRHIPHRLPILTRPRPCHRPARSQVHLKVRAHEDFLIRLIRNEPAPNLLHGGGNVIRKNQWCLRHVHSPSTPLRSRAAQDSSKRCCPPVKPFVTLSENFYAG